LNKVKWIIFAVVTVGIITALIVYSKGSQIDVSKINANTVQIANKQDGNIADHIFGKSGSKVTLIEYGDFECPACGNVNPSIINLTNKYKDQLQFVFRNFPLTTIHPNAMAAAAAVEAAGFQGKYWDMHAKVYQQQSSWSDLTGDDRTGYFVNLAKQLDLNTTKFKNDMSSTNINSKILYDQAIGFKLNLDSTPTFYLNSKKLDPSVASDSTKLEAAIVQDLKIAGVALPTQTE
jgi:protein-disulfide isomerase